MSFFSLLHRHGHHNSENAAASTSAVTGLKANPTEEHRSHKVEAGHLSSRTDSGKSSSLHSGWCFSPHRDSRDHVLSHACISSAASVKLPRRTTSTHPEDLTDRTARSSVPVEAGSANRSHSEGAGWGGRSRALGWKLREKHAGHSRTAQHLSVGDGQSGLPGAEGGALEKHARGKGDESAPPCRHSRWRFGESPGERSFSSILHSAMLAMKSLPATLQREWSMVRKIYRQSGRVKHTQRLERAHEAKLHKFGLHPRPSSSKQLPSTLRMQQIVPTVDCASALIKQVHRNLDKSMRDFQHASPTLSLRREQLFPPGQEFVVRTLERSPPFTTMALVAGRLLGGGSEAMVFAAEDVNFSEKSDAFLSAQEASKEISGECLPSIMAIKIYLCEANLLEEPFKAAEEAEAVEWLQMAFWRLVPPCVDVPLSRRLGVATPSWVGSVEGMPLVSCGDSHFAILNRISGMPLMLGDLLAIPPAALRLSDRIYLILRLIQVVANLHCLGVLHNDLKIENLLIGLNGQLYVGDLGAILPNTGRPTKFQRIGTDVYLDPQSAADFLRDDEDFSVVYSPLRDAWATGIICYYIWCSGALPYNLNLVYNRVVEGRQMFKFIADLPTLRQPLLFAGSPSEQSPEVSEICRIIESLLRLDRSSRKTPQSIVEQSFLYATYRV